MRTAGDELIGRVGTGRWGGQCRLSWWSLRLDSTRAAPDDSVGLQSYRCAPQEGRMEGLIQLLG